MTTRSARLRAATVVFAAGSAAVFAPDSSAQSIGSFVSGERPMYIELDELVSNQPFRLQLRNLPENTQNMFLVFSLGVEPTDLTGGGTPGFLGPDLTQNFGAVVQIADDDILNTAAPLFAGVRLYFQPWVIQNDGEGRLGSMLVAEQRSSFPPPPPDPMLPIPLTTQEVLPSGKSGWDREHGHVAVGVPFPQGMIQDVDGEAMLTLTGAAEGQFSTMATWPDGSVKWALVEYFTNLDAGTSHEQIAVDQGSGNFGGADVASTLSEDVVVFNTGRLGLLVDVTTANVFDFLEIDGEKLLQTSEPNTFVLIDADDHEWTYHGLGGELTVNGPVRAELRIDGVLTRSSNVNDDDRVYVKTYLSADKDEPALRARVSLRNTSIHQPRNLLFRGFSWQGQLKVEGTIQVRAPEVATNGDVKNLVATSISGNQNAAIYQGFAQNTEHPLTTSHNDSSYTPFLERLGDDDFAVEGVRIRIASVDFAGPSTNDGFSAETEYADPAFLDLWSASSELGMTAAVEHAAYSWPNQITGKANGEIEVQLFPTKSADDDHDYPLTWMTSETRTFVLRPSSSRADDPIEVMSEYDYPLAARPPLWAYNQSEVYPWRLVTEDQVALFMADTDISNEPVSDEQPIRTIYRFANGTGGSNNRWQSTLSYYQWLRHGHGGSYLRAYWESIYKVDKMPLTLDDGSLTEAPEVEDETTATKRGKFYDGSKHTYFQVVPDMAFHRGLTYLADSQPHYVETVMHPDWTSTQPFGNFVNGTYGAMTNSSIAMLQFGQNTDLEGHIREYMDQWAKIVYKQPNNLGVDTETMGWQAPLGTPAGSANNPDGYFVTRGTGKGVDFDNHGYTMQVWTDYRQAALAYHMVSHYLSAQNPNDPLISTLGQRAQDFYNFARRSALDDHYFDTGEHFLTDIFAADAGDENADPFDAPGPYVGDSDATSYALHPWINFYLEQQPSESAYSYGVELVRSISKTQLDKLIHDPTLHDFIARYLVEHGLANP